MRGKRPSLKIHTKIGTVSWKWCWYFTIQQVKPFVTYSCDNFKQYKHYKWWPPWRTTWLNVTPRDQRCPCPGATGNIAPSGWHFAMLPDIHARLPFISHQKSLMGNCIKELYRAKPLIQTFFKYWPITFFNQIALSMPPTFRIWTNIMVTNPQKNKCLEYEHNDIYELLVDACQRSDLYQKWPGDKWQVFCSSIHVPCYTAITPSLLVLPVLVKRTRACALCSF